MLSFRNQAVLSWGKRRRKKCKCRVSEIRRQVLLLKKVNIAVARLSCCRSLIFSDFRKNFKCWIDCSIRRTFSNPFLVTFKRNTVYFLVQNSQGPVADNTLDPFLVLQNKRTFDSVHKTHRVQRTILFSWMYSNHTICYTLFCQKGCCQWTAPVPQPGDEQKRKQKGRSVQSRGSEEMVVVPFLTNWKCLSNKTRFNPFC